MDFTELYNIILKIYLDCGITQFPIDCFDIVEKCGYKVIKYSNLSPKKMAACISLSHDSCLIEDKLYYEDRSIPERIRFSLMHEMGHIFLNTSSEDLANIFASHILAPRIMIHQKTFVNAEHIHQRFGLSYAAANNALVDYKKWFEHIARTTRTPSEPERNIQSLFPNLREEESKKELPKSTLLCLYSLRDSQQWYYSSDV